MTVIDNEDPADPSAHEPRVTDAPEAVWLVYGDLERDATHHECCASGEVMWCEDAQFAADVRYLRADLLYSEARQIAAQEVAAERERWRDVLAFAEAALADIGDADREPGDDLAWCEKRAAEALPHVRAALGA